MLQRWHCSCCMSLMLYFANATAGVRLSLGVVDGRDLKLKSNIYRCTRTQCWTCRRPQLLQCVPKLVAAAAAAAATTTAARTAPPSDTRRTTAARPTLATTCPTTHWHGCIKCVRALQDIAPLQEITVDYGFNGIDGYPEWWQQQLQQQLQPGSAVVEPAPKRQPFVMRANAHGPRAVKRRGQQQGEESLPKQAETRFVRLNK